MSDLITKLKICEQAKQYSDDNNRILNKDLNAKYNYIEKLKIAIKLYHQSLKVISSNSSLKCTQEAAIHMDNMYHYRNEMFKLAGIKDD